MLHAYNKRPKNRTEWFYCHCNVNNEIECSHSNSSVQSRRLELRHFVHFFFNIYSTVQKVIPVLCILCGSGTWEILFAFPETCCTLAFYAAATAKTLTTQYMVRLSHRTVELTANTQRALDNTQAAFQISLADGFHVPSIAVSQ